MRRTVSLAITLSLLSGCIGSFALTNEIYDFNREVDDSLVVQEIVFLALLIVPVYEIGLFVDAVVLNTIEAITGENPLARAELESRVVTLADGTTIAVVPDADGSITIELDREGRKLQRRLRRAANRIEIGAASLTMAADRSAVLVDETGTVTRIDAAAIDRAARAYASGGTEALVAEVAAFTRHDDPAR